MYSGVRPNTHQILFSNQIEKHMIHIDIRKKSGNIDDEYPLFIGSTYSSKYVTESNRKHSCFYTIPRKNRKYP